MSRSRLLTAALTLIVGWAGSAQGLTATFNAPDYDRWMYPFNATPGIRSTASTFGAFDDPAAFDDRDGQFHVAFNVASQMQALQPGQSYEIHSATVTATHFSGSFAYDPTYDSYQTYLDPGDPDFIADADAGRPIVLAGLGFASPYTGLDLIGIPGPPGFAESDAFAFADPSLPGVRNVFASDATGTDISNNVNGGFDFTPFAVGTVAGLNAGDSVAEGSPGTSAGSTFSFAVNLTDSDILAYIESGIDSGTLGFSITSLHGAAQQAGGTNPNFYTSDNFDPAAIAPTLVIDYSIVPEPASLALLGLGGLTLLARRRHA